MRKQYIAPLSEDIKLEALMAESKILDINQPSNPVSGLTAE